MMIDMRRVLLTALLTVLFLIVICIRQKMRIDIRHVLLAVVLTVLPLAAIFIGVDHVYQTTQRRLDARTKVLGAVGSYCRKAGHMPSSMEEILDLGYLKPDQRSILSFKWNVRPNQLNLRDDRLYWAGRNEEAMLVIDKNDKYARACSLYLYDCMLKADLASSSQPSH